MPNSMFRELCKPELLKIGWHLAQLDSRDDFVEDPLRHADFASQLDLRLRYIIEQLTSGRYRPRNVLDVDIPKSALTVRPGSVLPIEEATILHAIVYLIAPRLDSLLSPSVYSYRLHEKWKARVSRGRSMFVDDELELPFLKRATIKRFDPMESWYIAWPEFDAARKSAVSRRHFTHVTKTDISAYFENIDLRMLEDLLKQRLRFEPKLLALLFRILGAWTRDTAAGVTIWRGLPQGNDVSSFLGNFYLVPLDRELDQFCRRRKAVWYRYVDDIDIFTRSFEDAREAVLLVNRVLRSLHLNLQGSKTKILSGRQLRTEYSHKENDRVGDLIKKIGSLPQQPSRARFRRSVLLRRADTLAKRFSRRLPVSIRSLDEKNNRLLRRLMTFYAFANSARLKRTALACLREQPERRLMEKSLRYLRNLKYRHHDDLAKRLLNIASDTKYVTPYQLASIIQTVGQLHPKSPASIATRIRKMATRTDADWLVKQKAAEALFCLPCGPRSAYRVARTLLETLHPWVRRAAALLMLKAEATSAQKTIDRLVFHPDSSLHLAGLLWKRYESDIPFRDAELQRLRSINDDHAFLKNVHRFWAIGRVYTRTDAERLERILDPFVGSRSPVVRWHVKQLLKRCSPNGSGVTTETKSHSS
jgi:hypothetical protein